MHILQFGEGNFLRTFADAYFDARNRAGDTCEVTIVKPIPQGTLDAFEKQSCIYHIVLRGRENGRDTEDVYRITSVRRAIDPFSHPEEFFSMASDPDLHVIVSNTTEAGICYRDTDVFGALADVTYPAKLTEFLYRRYTAGGAGVYILPVELIDNNADALYDCVNRYITLWNLPEDFRAWNDRENFYCNTLVDRIVSGYPKDGETRARLKALVGEPFGLWAVDTKGNVGRYIRPGHFNIDVVLTDDIGYYKKRKVRVLNGSHTNMVPVGLLYGAETVCDCMTDERLRAFIDETLKEEIVPFVSDDREMTEAFARQVKERFENPYLGHRLTSIALNSISKWRARVLPSFRDYYEKEGRIPPHLTFGFAAWMALYASAVRKEDGTYAASLPTCTAPLKDDEAYLSYFAAGGDIIRFMERADVWGENLTAYAGFADAVKNYVEGIRRGRTDFLPVGR